MSVTWRRTVAAVMIAGVATVACSKRLVRTLSQDVTTVNRKAAFLKAHMRNGDVYVFDAWAVDAAGTTVTGRARKQGPERGRELVDTFTVAVVDVAVFESNVIENAPTVAGLTVITAISAAVTIACIANPKACFGSCPTFYAPDADGAPVLQAEGFSDSISPALEATDIDALWRSRAQGPFELEVTNEAYETHVIKAVELLAVPTPSAGRVVIDAAGGFHHATVPRAPVTCHDTDGETCVQAVAAVDAVERISLTDAHDLAARETVLLSFDAAKDDQPRGVVVAARQSLVTTFLLYQGLAYIGESIGTFLAAIERGQPAMANGRGLQRALGGVEVQVADAASADGWRTVGEITETGPLAIDVHFVQLPPGTIEVRLRMPRGGWRLDHVGLVDVGPRVLPIVVPAAIIGGSISPDYGASRPLATEFPVVTQPGDRYRLRFDLPEHAGGYDLFLSSRGYYLEWMREEWLREHAPWRAAQMLMNPTQALKDLAPAFKAIEPDAEAMFWRSRYATP